MLRVTFIAAIFICATNHAQSDGSEEATTREAIAIGIAITELVDHNLDGGITDGLDAVIDGAYNFALSVKDTIAGAVNQTLTENIE